MGCAWGKLQGTQVCSTAGAHTQLTSTPKCVPRAFIHPAGAKHPLGHGEAAQSPRSTAQSLCRATAPPAVVFLPISLLKAIKELQHLQPSAPHHSVSQRAGAGNVLELDSAALGWERKPGWSFAPTGTSCVCWNYRITEWFGSEGTIKITWLHPHALGRDTEGSVCLSVCLQACDCQRQRPQHHRGLSLSQKSKRGAKNPKNLCTPSAAAQGRAQQPKGEERWERKGKAAQNQHYRQ